MFLAMVEDDQTAQNIIKMAIEEEETFALLKHFEGELFSKISRI